MAFKNEIWWEFSKILPKTTETREAEGLGAYSWVHVITEVLVKPACVHRCVSIKYCNRV